METEQNPKEEEIIESMIEIENVVKQIENLHVNQTENFLLTYFPTTTTVVRLNVFDFTKPSEVPDTLTVDYFQSNGRKRFTLFSIILVARNQPPKTIVTSSLQSCQTKKTYTQGKYSGTEENQKDEWNDTAYDGWKQYQVDTKLIQEFQDEKYFPIKCEVISEYIYFNEDVPGEKVLYFLVLKQLLARKKL